MIRQTGDSVLKKNIKEKFVKKYLNKIQNFENEFNDIIENEVIDR